MECYGLLGGPMFCPEKPFWSQWNDWSSCSPSCGKGKRSKTRICVDGKYGGDNCQKYHETNYENCTDLPECPENCVLRCV